MDALLEQLFKNVKKLRKKQTEYFKTRKHTTLAECKALEQKVDFALQLIEKREGKQLNIFND